MKKVLDIVLGGYYQIVPVWLAYFVLSTMFVCSDQIDHGFRFIIGIFFGVLWISSMTYTVLGFRKK